MWHRVTAVVVSEEPTFLGTRLCFRFHTGFGETTGCEFRWGRVEETRAALDSYKPGTFHIVSYGFAGDVETKENYSYWNHNKVLLGILAFAGMFIAPGLWIYRSSYGWQPDSPRFE